jgi:hypothetical protein
MTILRAVLMCVIPAACFAQAVDPLDVKSKLLLHGRSIYSFESLAVSAAYAGYNQRNDAPSEWHEGSVSYAERVGSTVAYSAVHAGLAFGLDSALHEDPRYFRSGSGGFLRRTGHALRGTVLTRTDSGGETFSTWRFGSAYGAAFLSNEWYPDRLNTVRLGVWQGSLRMGLDFAVNFGSEFWPDIKRNLLHRKP